MNKKICELMTILINSPNQYFKHEDLARLLSVSTRSIRNYISNISYFLSGQNITHLVKITNQGITFTGDTQEGEFLTSQLIDSDFYTYKLSSEERVNIIAIKITLMEKACTISSLAEQFNVSRVTIIKDMEQVRQLLAQNNMSCDNSTNHGYLLTADEKDRRELVLRLVQNSGDSYPLYNKVNLYDFFIQEEFFKFQNYDAYAEILRKAEDKYEITVSDAYFENALFTLKLMALRIRRGFELKLTEEEIQVVKKRSVYQVAQYALKLVNSIHEISFSESETAYFAHKLYEYHFYNSRRIEDTRCIQTHIVIRQFLTKVGSELKLPLSDDSQLVEELGKHLSAMKKVHMSGTSIQNDFRDQVIKEYPVYYELVLRNKNLLEEHFGYPFYKDDIAYIILYLVVGMERYFEEDTIPKAIVVCHTGIGTAKFLVQELKANFNIKILASTSSHKLPDAMRQYDYDLIISTITLPKEAGNWIKVNPMLDDNDILGLQRILFGIKKDKRKQILTRMQLKKKEDLFSAIHLQRLAQVMPMENVALDVSCGNWQDAIRSAAGILLKKGSIREQYIQAIEDSVKKNGAYFVFCPGIALAHAGPDDGVERFEISLVRLSSPVCFGHKTNDPVRYILCFGSSNRTEDADLILKLMNIISSPDILRQLDEEQDKTIFYHHIIEYGGVTV